jgi:hypothetical protein
MKRVIWKPTFTVKRFFQQKCSLLRRHMKTVGYGEPVPGLNRMFLRFQPCRNGFAQVPQLHICTGMQVMNGKTTENRLSIPPRTIGSTVRDLRCSGQSGGAISSPAHIKPEDRSVLATAT